MIDTASKRITAASQQSINTMSRAGAAWFFLQYVILALVIPLFVLSQIPITKPLPLLVLVVINISALALARNGAARFGWTKLLDTSFWVFVYVFFGIAALVQRTMGSFPWELASPPDNIWLITDLIIIFGCFGFILGRSLMPRIQKPFTLRLAPRRLVRLTFPILILTVSLFTAAVGFSGFGMHRSARSAAILHATGSLPMSLILSNAVTIPLIVLMPALILLRPRINGGYRTRFSALIVLTLLVTLMMINFYNSPRFLAGTVLLSGAIAYLLQSRRQQRWLRLIPLTLSLGLIAIFPLSSMFRRGFATVSLEAQSVVAPLARSGDFDAYRQVALSVEMVGSQGTLQGENLLSALAFWMPRSIWTDKLPHSGELLGEFSNQSYLNLSAPLWAEGMLAFGAIGVFLLLFIWGAWTGLLDRATYQDVVNKRIASSRTLLATVLCGFSIILLRGALMPTLASLIPIIAVVLMMSWLFRETLAHRNQIQAKR